MLRIGTPRTLELVRATPVTESQWEEYRLREKVDQVAGTIEPSLAPTGTRAGSALQESLALSLLEVTGWGL